MDAKQVQFKRIVLCFESKIHVFCNVGASSQTISCTDLPSTRRLDEYAVITVFALNVLCECAVTTEISGNFVLRTVF